MPVFHTHGKTATMPQVPRACRTPPPPPFYFLFFIQSTIICVCKIFFKIWLQNIPYFIYHAAFLIPAFVVSLNPPRSRPALEHDSDRCKLCFARQHDHVWRAGQRQRLLRSVVG